MTLNPLQPFPNGCHDLCVLHFCFCGLLSQWFQLPLFFHLCNISKHRFFWWIRVCVHLSTIRSRVRLRRQSVSPFSPSSTSRPQGTHGNVITRGGQSMRRRPGYVPCPGDRDMDGEGGWGPEKIDLFSHEYCISIMVWLLNQGKVFYVLFTTCQMQSIELSQNQKALIFKDNIFIPFPISFSLTWTDYINIQRNYKPARSTRSIGRCSALGVGLRAWRGERVLGVEAGEFGSAGSSGSGYPLATKTSEAHMRQTLCWHGRTTGCLMMSLHTGQCSSNSRLFMFDW